MLSGNQGARERAERVLDRFKNDLWIQRRLALDEVIECLKQECQNYDEDAQTAQESRLRRETFQDYQKFVEFLRDQCSGENITSDKQWGHLLNLMSVSRKVNHRSARFSDIIKSKHNIESAFSAIRNFNESIKQANNINEMLGDLDKSLESSCQLEVVFTKRATQPSQQLLITEVSKAIRLMENTSGPLVSSLRMQLSSNKPIEALFDRDRQTWRDTFNRLECTFDSLYQFLTRYNDFLKNMSELRPLLQTLDGRKTKSSNRMGPLEKDGTRQCQLASCKAEFQKVVDFEQKLSEFLEAQVKQKARASASANQQVQPLHLSQLLDTRLRFKDEILTLGLEAANKSIRHCQETLTDIESSLRLEFGRFYFLNDLELLTLIGQDVSLIEQCEQAAQQRLIRKIFNNSIEGFTFGFAKDGSKCITGVKSCVGERIDFAESQWVPLKKPVNVYSLEVVRILNEVARKLRLALSSILQRSIQSWDAQSRFDLRSPTNDLDWSLPIQLLDLAEQVKFTRRMELELSSTSANLESLIDFYQARLNGLRSMSDVRHIDDETGGVVSLKMSAAISITVHFLALLMNLNQSSVGSVHHWSWQKLPRFYSSGRQTDDEWQLKVKIATATFVYRFDLLNVEITSQLDMSSKKALVGVKRLISTTSSDRCFLAASQAISKLKSGASPFGPAGSGKTETIKALGHLLGCQVVVHNCDQTNDSDSLERLIWGLAHTGLWGCFDEFNRLSSSTLSSVSSVLELVQASLRSGSITIQLNGGEMKSIDPGSAFFVTLNPADGSKYRARRRLPANLRSLFLPVAMHHVQIEAIVRQMLLVHGSSSQFGLSTMANHLDAANSSDIAHRLSSWIQVARVELADNTGSNRCQFDLRLVVVILRRSFQLLAQEPLDVSNPIARLHDIMVSAIQTELCPRLEEAQLDALARTLSHCFGANGVVKRRPGATLELKSQLESRSGVILSGEERSGKSTAWRSLLAESNREGETICYTALNPKAHQKDRLFGHFDVLAAKWIDGVFTKLVRHSAWRLHNEPHLRQAWIILDGDIDPDWVECLNSVLDDNQVLTLGSGERIDFVISADKCIKLIFETGSVRYASPATISRLGLVYQENQFVAQGRASSNSLDLTIVYGGGGSRSRVEAANTIAGCELRSVAYACNEHSNSDSLVQLMEVSSNTACTFIIQNLELIGSAHNEHKWAARTFVELLRYILTYKRFHDRQLNEIQVSERTRFVITVDSLDAVADRRLAAIARQTIEAPKDTKKGTNELSAKTSTVESFVGDNFQANPEGSGVLVIRSDHLHDIKRELILCLQTRWPADIRICKFNNEAAQIGSIEKLEKLAQTKARDMGADGGRKCVFFIDSLELYLMKETTKRKLYDLVNLLAIKNLIGADNKILVCLDNTAHQLELKFWASVGQSFAIESGASIEGARKLEQSLGRKLGWQKGEGLQHLEWLSQQVTQMSAGRESIVQDHFVAILVEMIGAMREGLRRRTKMLRSGLDKLAEFERQVAAIKCKKQREDRVLREKRLKIENLMLQIDSELAKSENKRADMERLQKLLEVKSNTLKTQTHKIQCELDRVLPLIDSSRREVSSCLKAEALNEIKALRAPPKTIKDILDVLFLFLDLQDTSWASMKAHLTRLSLRDELTNYDFSKRLDGARLHKIRGEIEARRDSFQMRQAKHASAAIMPILNWINAALEFGEVSVGLKPLMEAKDRLEGEAHELAESRGRVESDRRQLMEKVAVDRELLERYRADYAAAIAAAERMAEQLAGAGKIMENSSKQVSSWREQLNKLDALASNERSLCQICLLCAATTTWADTLEQVGWLVARFGGVCESHNQLEIFLTLTRDNVNTLLDSMGEERIETSTVESSELAALFQLLRLKLSLLFRPARQPRLPFVQLDRSGCERDERLASALSTRKLVCSAHELLVVRPSRGPIGGWRQSFDLGLRMDKLLAIQLDGADLDTVDIVLQHCSSARILLFGDEASFERGARNPLSQLLHTFSIDQQCEHEQKSLADGIGKLVLQQCEPEIGSQMDELERSLVLKQGEQRTLEASLLTKLTQFSSDKDMAPPLSDTTLKSDLVGSLNELQRASESLARNIVEIRQQICSVQQRQAQHAELSTRLANFYVNFLRPAQGGDHFYALPLERLVELSLARSGQIAFGTSQLAEMLTRAMCPMRPECRRDFRNRLVRSSAELAGLVHATDAADVAKLIESAYRRSADLCDNLINLLTVDKDLEHASTRSALIGRQRRDERNFDLVVILHDAKKPSPQVVVDELFRRARSAFIAPDNACHYEKVYARSQPEAAVAAAAAARADATPGSATKPQSGQPLEAHLRRLMMSSSLAGGASKTSTSQQRAKPRTQTKCVCLANAHLAAGWINTQLLQLLNDTCRNADERYVFILVGESSAQEEQQRAGARPNNLEPAHELDLSLLEAATLKFWYDELALNALDRYNLYRESLCAAHAAAGAGASHKSVPPTEGEPAQKVAMSREQLAAKRASQESSTGELIEDLVMFHVVCQELIGLKRLLWAKGQSGGGGAGPTLWQKTDYNFDYEQLSLALQVWSQLEELDERAKRELLCHLLESIIYGSRLETLEDEELLKFLLNRFLLKQATAPLATVRSGRLLALQRLARGDLSAPGGDKMSGGGADWASSSARYAEELAGLIGAGAAQ